MTIIENLKQGDNNYYLNKKPIVISYFVYISTVPGHEGRLMDCNTNQSINFNQAGLYFFNTTNNKLYITTSNNNTYEEITNIDDYIYFTQSEINTIFNS